MKKNKGRQMITIAGGVLACSIQMMGCYPIAPAYFAAAFLEEINGVWLTVAMYIGMLYFMPLTATVKYAVALLVTAGAIMGNVISLNFCQRVAPSKSAAS